MYSSLAQRPSVIKPNIKISVSSELNPSELADVAPSMEVQKRLQNSVSETSLHDRKTKLITELSIQLPNAPHSDGYEIYRSRAQFLKSKGVDYNLTEENLLGRGTFGKVYRSYFVEPGYPVAVKAFYKSRSFNDSNRDGDQIYFSKKLDSPNLMKYIDMDDDTIIMEYYDSSTTLKEQLISHLELDELRAIRDILNGVLALHSAGLAHNDLKPANIIFSGDRYVICDFGSIQDISITNDITESGTKCYFAPEKLTPLLNSPDFTPCKSDIWAIGLIFYNIITKQDVTKIFNELESINKGVYCEEIEAKIEAIIERDIPDIPNRELLAEFLKGFLKYDQPQRFDIDMAVEKFNIILDILERSDIEPINLSKEPKMDINPYTDCKTAKPASKLLTEFRTQQPEVETTAELVTTGNIQHLENEVTQEQENLVLDNTQEAAPSASATKKVDTCDIHL